MTTVNPTTGNSTANAASKAIANNSMNNLGINDFIQLMTTQLKYQDPTQPQDSTQFVAQLAQFSTVSGVQQMNSSISSLLGQLKSSQALNATSLVGHSVLLKGSSMPVSAGQSVYGAIDTPSGASNLNVTVVDSSGQPVRHLSVPADKGLSAFLWDGKDDAGNAVSGGTYGFNASANIAGKPTAATTFLANRIDSVTIDPTTNDLQLNTDSLGTVTLADVRQVF